LVEIGGDFKIGYFGAGGMTLMAGIFDRTGGYSTMALKSNTRKDSPISFKLIRSRALFLTPLPVYLIYYSPS